MSVSELKTLSVDTLAEMLYATMSSLAEVNNAYASLENDCEDLRAEVTRLNAMIGQCNLQLSELHSEVEELTYNLWLADDHSVDFQHPLTEPKENTCTNS